jgi:hypothetical protein
VAGVDQSVQCTVAVGDGLERVNEIRRSVAVLRGKLSAGQGNSEDLERRINALLSEAAAIRQKSLTVPFSKELPSEGPAKDIDISDALAELLDMERADIVKLRVTPPLPQAAPVAYACADTASLCLPNPRLPSATWKVSVVAKGTEPGKDKELASGKVTAPMPQWAPTVELPLTVGFAGNRTFSAQYDAFGRMTKGSWGSEARGATIAEAVAGYAETGAALKGKLEGLDRQKAEIEELETQQKLNRLRACREILEAGGSACPTEAPATAN